METVYYHLDTRRVSTCEKASGEALPVRQSYAVLRRVEEKRAGEGCKVLDMAAYRRKLEQDTPDEEETLPQVSVQTVAPVRTRARRVRRAGIPLDVVATLAILVMVTVVVMGFLPFL